MKSSEPGQSSIPEIELDLSSVFEAGAVLLALLALPSGSETERGEIVASLCKLALKAQHNLNTVESSTAVPMKPLYALRSDDEVGRSLKKIERLLRDRVLAARMAILFLQHAEQGAQRKLPKDVSRLSLNEAANIAIQDMAGKGGVTGNEEPGNIETRIWRPSLPVIHLAVALTIAMQEVERAGKGEITIGHVLTHRWLIERIVVDGSRYTAMIEGGGVLPGKPVSLIKVRARG